MELKTGARFKSAVSTAEVIVIRTVVGDVDLRCGGRPMRTMDDDSTTDGAVLEDDASTVMGKRYVNSDSSVEVLCVKAGAGGLSIGDEALETKEAKALPASD